MTPPLSIFDPLVLLIFRGIPRMAIRLEIGGAVFLTHCQWPKAAKHGNGHAFGDIALSIVAAKAKQIFGEESVYRFGGDEFVIIETDQTLTDFQSLMASFSSSLAQIEIEDKPFPIRVSVGRTYGKPETQEMLRLMLQYADELLYEAKGKGKHQFVIRRFDLDI